MYTLDPTCTPKRIVDIREVIAHIDEQIESNLTEDHTHDGETLLKSMIDSHPQR